MISLKNKKRQMLVFNLETEYFCKKKGLNGKDKPESVTFLGLERKNDFPEEILECEEIANAIRSGVLRQVENRPVSKKKSKGDK